ncbi:MULTISPECIES: hypothetical protein [unclassified Corynebacterium]|uniref:hypothetical protein n=1 Tax=unclassified Corynebacterium TaxID=2624378 RepID=UPI0029C9D7B1|nr:MULTISPECIES: hypothetical protein [unclassified Corynebacterium]WPF65187.1 hypothetical protein OLX12_06210 [Corynebacterium sp. 22KM0430]WPF67683.1 hypothetical protein OLW90_06205 [Corynebacterium sp. 21KM1197]
MGKKSGYGHVASMFSLVLFSGISFGIFLNREAYIMAIASLCFLLFSSVLFLAIISIVFGRRMGWVFARKTSGESLTFVTHHVWLGMASIIPGMVMCAIFVIFFSGDSKYETYIITLATLVTMLIVLIYYGILNPGFGTGRVYVYHGGMVIDGALRFTLVPEKFRVMDKRDGDMGDGFTIIGEWSVEKKYLFRKNTRSVVKKSIFINSIYIGSSDPERVRKMIEVNS